MVVAFDIDKDPSTDYFPKSAILEGADRQIITLYLEHEVGAEFGYLIDRSCAQTIPNSLSRAQGTYLRDFRRKVVASRACYAASVGSRLLIAYFPSPHNP
jgi:hypothetical protein